MTKSDAKQHDLVSIMTDRKFQLWYYTVSLRQMLLRSTGNKDVCNLDIYFADVSYVELPAVIDGIEVLETTQQDVEYIMQKTGHADKKITVLKSGNYKYFVVSSFMKVFENNLEFYELPFDIASDFGEVYK